MTGPRTGAQEHVKYCPNCRGDLRPTQSKKQPAETSHSYQCDTCDWVFEINEIERRR